MAFFQECPKWRSSKNAETQLKRDLLAVFIELHSRTKSPMALTQISIAHPQETKGK